MADKAPAAEQFGWRAGPVVRPRGMPPHARDAVRRSRLYTEGRNLVVRDRRMRERRYPVGAGGIRRAVFLPPGDLWETVSKRPAERWGVLVFQKEDGSDVVRVPLAEWLPEAEDVGAGELRPGNCLNRTGLRELVDALGIPLEERSAPRDRAGEGREKGQRAHRVVPGELPRWYSWIKGTGAFAWLIALVIGFAADLDWCMPVAAGALLLLPAIDIAVRVRGWWLIRRDERPGGLLAEAVVITPSPGAATRPTRRFRETAAVRILPHDVVVTNAAGEERWLAKGGPYGVARLVRVSAPKSRNPLGVEVRDGQGETRVLLPWASWFAGPDGQGRWSQLVSALGVPLADEEFGKRLADGEPWWRGHVHGADARKLSPLEGKEARRETSWHGSVVGGNELLIVPIFSAVLLAGLFSGQAAARLSGVLSALTILGELGPAAAASLRSRLSFDKPDHAS